MNEQLVNALIAALREQTAAQREQTEAINRLAESNVALSDVIIQSLAADDDIEITSLGDDRPVYLSQRMRG
ncbi:HU family DNA-binding protein [Klebsiella oxytoca]